MSPMVGCPFDVTSPPAAAFSHRISMPEIVRAQPCGLSLRSCRRNTAHLLKIHPTTEPFSRYVPANKSLDRSSMIRRMVEAFASVSQPEGLDEHNQSIDGTTPGDSWALAERWRAASRKDFLPTKSLAKERRSSAARLALL